MANALFEFDPTSEDSTNSPLEIWNTASYAVSAFTSPAPPLDIQYAGSVDTEGSLPSSRKHQNRQIVITVEVLSAAALRALQAKVAKIAREGGTAKLTLPASSEVIVFDLHAADTFEPQLDIVYFVNSGAFCTVNLSLIAKPYGRGAPESLTLSSSTATANQPHVFTATGVKGDMDAVGHLVVENATNAKTVLHWGLRSRYYSAAASAGLFFEAEAGAIITGAAHAGPSGASGGGASKVVRASSIGTSFSPIIEVQAGGSSNLTHIGTFRAFVRAQVSAANTGTVSVRASWLPYTTGYQLFGDWVAVVDPLNAPVEGQWVILDLGLISVQKALLGTERTILQIHAKSTVAADQIDLDWVTLVPVREGYGRAEAYTGGGYLATDAIDVGDSAVLHHQTVLGVYRGGNYEGDYLRIPPAGAEGRTLQIVYMLTGDSGSNLTSTLMDATNLDATTVSVSYVPRFLVVPSP